MKLLISIVAVLLAWPVAIPAQNKPYDFRGDEIHVDQISHWRNWLYQNNLVRDLAVGIDSTRLFDFTTSGIKPRFFTGKKNYVLDAEEFEYLVGLPGFEGLMLNGNFTALSNDFLASDVGDGDANTFWEPDRQDFTQEGLRNWQVQVDLGRTVWADSIVVIFPPIESGGDVTVPLIPVDLATFAELPVELQAQIEVLSRRTALNAIAADRDVLSAAGDTLARQGEVLVQAGAGLPRDLEQLRLLNELGIAAVEVEGGEDLGDVPKLFVVEVSMGKQSGSDKTSQNYRYDTVGRGEAASNLRRFVFPLTPLDIADSDQDGFPDFDGTFVHIVRLTIFDSDLEQKEFLGDGAIGQLAYEELASARQGQRIFQRVTAGGFTKRINDVVREDGSAIAAEEIFNGLDEDEKGPIRYFTRELPRVSEIQVWGQGPNLAYRPELRAGAGYEDGGRGSPLLATDGVYLTKWFANAWDIKYSTGGGGQDQLVCCTMWLDLGATFWVNRIFSGTITTTENNSEGALFGLHMKGSDGTALRALNMQTPEDFPQLEFGLAWSDLVSEVHKNNNSARVRMFKEEFSKRKLRFFQLRNDDPTGARSGAYSAPGHFNEFQLYGEGYPAEVNLATPPIVLLPGVETVEAAALVRQRRALGEISWEAEAVVRRVDPFTGQNIEVAEPLDLHPEVDVQVQTRTSDTIDSLFTYFEVTGLGTTRESKAEVDVQRYFELQDLWAEFNLWDSLPDSRNLRLRQHQTGRDDDRDNQVDEDPIDGIDNDGDKLIDEDALTGDVGGPNSRGTITLIKHKRRQDDDGDGAEDEDPIDGIDNDGDFLIDEDGKKIAKPRQESLELITPFFAGWSAWSEPYQPQPDGEFRALITSPSPRKFLQVRINIVSNDPDVTARIKTLQVDLAAPITTEVVGELAILTDQGVERPVSDLVPLVVDYAPPQDIPPLAQQPFSYFIRAAGPDLGADNPAVAQGFDQILLVTPSNAELTVVRMGRVQIEEGESDTEAMATRFSRSFAPVAGDATRMVDGSGAQLVVSSSNDELMIQFPGSINQESSEEEHVIIELQFKTQTLNAGTEFLSFVRSSTLEGGIFQRVEAEGQDATELVDSKTARPTILHSNKIIDEVEIPQVFTPNGDGVNDELEVQFTVLRLREDRPMQVGFYDLSGRLMGKARSMDGKDAVQSGTIRFVWDGRNGEGELVPPGIYMARIELDADSEDVSRIRLVNVAY